MASTPDRSAQSSAWRIVEYLQTQGDASLRELQDYLGLTRTAVREHITTLEREGYVGRRTVHAGRGRPHYEFFNTDRARDLFACHCGSLAVTLLGEISDLVTPETMDRLMSRVSQKVALEYASNMETEAVRTRVYELADLMQKEGVLCSVHQEEDRDVLRLELFNCPYHELAVDHRQICEMDRSMIGQAVGAPVELIDCLMDEANSCNFGFRLGSDA